MQITQGMLYNQVIDHRHDRVLWQTLCAARKQRPEHDHFEVESAAFGSNFMTSSSTRSASKVFLASSLKDDFPCPTALTAVKAILKSEV